MHCAHFAADRCHSCPQLDLEYSQQVQNKENQLQQLLAPLIDPQQPPQFLTTVRSDQVAFRNKAKMVALGAAHQPLLGVVNGHGEAISLCDCPLYPAPMQQLLQVLPDWIRRAGIAPYNVAKKKGELKFVLLSEAPGTEDFMLRFVLRSEQALTRIEANLPELLQRFSHLRVVSANIQPLHAAILEGEQEIFLTPQHSVLGYLNDIPLHLRPQSFFQTNSAVAQQLYAQAKAWVDEINPPQLWDLFCGVGGFALHCADGKRQVTGIEISEAAIRCAQDSAQQLGISDSLHFAALDSQDFANTQAGAPQLVIVNPPRRGIGATLAQQLNDFAPPWLIYSSCNAQTLARDLQVLGNYQLQRVQLFDMFPHTEHYEVLTLLRLQPPA